MFNASILVLADEVKFLNSEVIDPVKRLVEPECLFRGPIDTPTDPASRFSIRLITLDPLKVNWEPVIFNELVTFNAERPGSILVCIVPPCLNTSEPVNSPENLAIILFY